ncbi:MULTISPECIES: hypothetical protein [Phyllobacteriaceae]|jgi:hypothetical protein|uniref:Uncharacterized protein n=1 Tax=Mesorhizobium hungaricum TaxID=1566387 RepID=A0A1C2E0U3_9HYPH|nr:MULTISPECIES: hypothetical protein [Mesorhizobium]MBN9235469.1 hypothetical protein [Mesorhizobium sp.]MDQ0331378.1 hypothetical protein [Mesorhizobium sp. YL-MeA3-2017]OCX20621.1 hypothetical protein QV13_08005 [Mesorhizobium hungaricum]
MWVAARVISELVLWFAVSIVGGSDTAIAQQPYLWGLTSDNCMERTEQQIKALAHLPRRSTVRTVFDPPKDGGPNPDDYLPCIKATASVADVMGLAVDSHTMASLKPKEVEMRMAAYIAKLGAIVRIWEIGNEVNGDWVGEDTLQKIEIMYDAAKAAQHLTALTLYYEPVPESSAEMIGWVDANIPFNHRMRAGLDYVFVSYYEDENGGHQLSHAEFDRVFGALASRFPNALLGIGEFGWGKGVPSDPAKRAALLERFYSYRMPSMTRFIGGGFYWHFRQTMVAEHAPDRDVLVRLMLARLRCLVTRDGTAIAHPTNI